MCPHATFEFITNRSFTLGIFYVTKQGWASELIWGNRTAALVEGYPQTAASIGCDRYYIIELSFWISCFLFLFFETRRKDIVEMTIHHVTTILLISISYMTGYARPGILVMIVHDIGDIFLYSAKSCQYRKLQGIADVLFAMFAVTFYITRLWCLPRYVIYPLVKHMWLDPRTGPIIGPMVEAGHLYTLMFLTSLLCVLVGLHTMWGTTIAKMIWKSMLCKDSVANNGDPRSDSEAEMENKRRRGPAAAVSRTKVHPPSMKERKHRG